MHCGRREGTMTSGPDWKKRAVRPVVGVHVAVFGYSQAKVLRMIIQLLAGKALANFGSAIDGREGCNKRSAKKEASTTLVGVELASFVSSCSMSVVAHSKRWQTTTVQSVTVEL